MAKTLDWGERRTHARKLPPRINRLPLPIKPGIAHAIRVIAAPIPVTLSLSTLPVVVALVVGADRRAGGPLGRADVRRHLKRVRVGVPHAELRAAGAVETFARSLVRLRGDPALHVGLAADELEAPRAAGVAVPRAVLGAGLVGRVPRLAAVGVHGDEVQRAVNAALDRGEVDVKGQLVILEREHLVLVLRLQEEEPRPDVGGEVEVGLEPLRQGVLGYLDAVDAGIVGTLEGASVGAVLDGVALSLVPGVAGEAVHGGVDYVQPSEVGVHGNLPVNRLAGPVGGAAAPL